MSMRHRYTNLTRLIFGNSLTLLIGIIARSFIGFLVSINLARYLGVSDFGVFSYVFNFLYFFEILPRLGMDSILTREISHNRESASSLLGNAFALRLILAFVSMTLVCLAITAIKGFSRVSFLVYISSFALFFSLQAIYETMFKAELKMLVPTVVNFLKMVAYAILVFLLIYFKGNLYGFIAASMISGFFALALIAVYSKRYFVVSPQFDFRIWRWLWKQSMPILLSGIFSLVYSRIDIIILERIKGFEAVGLYSAARKFSDTIILIPECACISLFPLLSRFFKEKKYDFNRVSAFGLKYMLIFITPIVIGTWFFSEQIIGIYGKNFTNSVFPLKLLILSSFFTFLNIVLVNAIIAAGRQKFDAILSGILMFVNVGANLVLIPTFSYNGASCAFLITEAICFIGYIIIFYRITKLPLSDIKLARLLFANIIFSLFLGAVRSVPFIVVLPVSVIVYLILILAFNIIKNDIGYFLGIIKISDKIEFGLESQLYKDEVN